MIKQVAKQCENCHGKGIVRVWKPESLRKAREKKGLSMRAMARKIEISAPYLNDIEHGYRPIPDKVLRAYKKLK